MPFLESDELPWMLVKVSLSTPNNTSRLQIKVELYDTSELLSRARPRAQPSMILATVRKYVTRFHPLGFLLANSWPKKAEVPVTPWVREQDRGLMLIVFMNCLINGVTNLPVSNPQYMRMGACRALIDKYKKQEVGQAESVRSETHNKVNTWLESLEVNLTQEQEEGSLDMCLESLNINETQV